MSDTNDNNNDTLRKKAKTNKIIYRNILDTPFSFKWPRIETDLNIRILDNLLKVLDPVGQYRRSLSAKVKGKSIMNKPLILSEMRLLLGINGVTRHLEKVIKYQRQHANKTEVDTDNDKVLTPVIFICRRDIKPLQLCTHLLSMSVLSGIKLVPLPLNAEKTLAKTLNLSKVSCLLIELSSNYTSVEEEALRVCLHEVSLTQASWPINPSLPVHYNNTCIKILETSSNIKQKKIKPKSYTTKSGTTASK
ncbi:hypothetical protein BJ944DRAFT_46968 [Cunninghamella echinulata]|nr:hypothetical protein BJ944DRAFT_46968 [Cunninghamella echinulata]